jgi:hypothetical protein
VIHFLIQKGILVSTESISIQEMSILLPNLITCVEMMIASVWHSRAFSVDTFRNHDRQKMSFKEAFWDSFYWLDIWYDIQFAICFIRNCTGSYHPLTSFSTNNTNLGQQDSDFIHDINL